MAEITEQEIFKKKWLTCNRCGSEDVRVQKDKRKCWKCGNVMPPIPNESKK